MNFFGCTVRHGVRLFAVVSAGIVFLNLSTAMAATVLPGLFNTGVDDNQNTLPDNAIDSHWQLVPPSLVDVEPVVATSAGAFPIPPWVADNKLSAWITPGADTNGEGNFDGSASYFWRASFDLTGVNPVPASITGQWSSDNGGLDILLNGDATGNTNTGQFAAFTPFTVNGPFLPGLNTLDFVVNNGGSEANPFGPTGVRVEFTGNGPEPPPPPPGVKIPGVFNTGVDGSKVTLPDNVADAHYAVTSRPAASAASPALTIVADGFPIPPWIANSATSRWLTASASTVGDGDDEPGDYTYQTSFDLTGYDLSKPITLRGSFAGDDSAVILLNNDATGISVTGFGSLVEFTLTSGFLPGINTLQFVVTNGGTTANPTGLRVEGLEVFASPIPEPGSALLLVLGACTLAGHGWRRRGKG